MKGRRLIRIVARWTLAVLLFAQGALVANACLRVDASPRAAFAMSEMDGCDMGDTNPNACLLGYLEQSDHSAAQPSVPAATRYILVSADATRPAFAPDTRATPPPPGAPPIKIRYCTLLI